MGDAIEPCLIYFPTIRKGATILARRKPRAGGKRRQLGRPPGPPENVRRNRVFAQVTDTEFRKLERLADEQDRPLSTVVYELLAGALKRRR